MIVKRFRSSNHDSAIVRLHQISLFLLSVSETNSTCQWPVHLKVLQDILPATPYSRIGPWAKRLDNMDFKSFPKIEVSVIQDQHKLACLPRSCISFSSLAVRQTQELSFSSLDWHAQGWRLTFWQLHAHLSGSISRECLHEIWLQKKKRGETTLEDPLVEMPVGKFDYNLETWVFRMLHTSMSLTFFLLIPELESMSYGNLASFPSSRNTFMLFATTFHLWYTPQNLSFKTFKQMELFTSSCVPLQGVFHQRISARMITSEQSSTVSQASILHRQWKRIWYSRLTAGTTRPQLLKSWTWHSSTEIEV